MSDLLLGIDVGTYSSKGVLVKPDGIVLKTHIVEHKMDIPQQGWAKQDADTVILPNRELRQQYNKLYENYLDLYLKNREIMHRLADSGA